MAELIDKIPPRSQDAEMAVLGSMLIEKEAIIKVVDLIKDSDFYSDAHRHIFRAVRDMYIENAPVDAITITEEIKKRKLLDAVGGAAYLTSLIHSVATAANVEHYAGIVREKSILRQLINTGTEMVAAAFNEKNSAEEILDKSEAMLYSVSERNAAKGFSLVPDMVHQTLEFIEKVHKDRKDIPGLRTHFDDLDSMLAGLQPSELVILAARPSMGKTSLALNMVENIALKEKKCVAVFSLEMSKEALMLRLLCSTAKVDLQKARRGFIANVWADLTTAASKLSEAPIYIDDSSSLTVLELRARARRLAMELKTQGKELSMVVIDYIQMMRGASNAESRQQEIAEISRSLKGLARDLKIPVVALSQLSRKTEEKGREGKPKLSDLRESGALEQDADVVMFIFREGYYKPDDPDLARQATIIVAKQRNGPTGEVNVAFLREFTRFENLDRRTT
jgi:replicative DNA helicase